MSTEIVNADANNLETIETAPISLATQITRAEIDVQISTAHAYPRSLTRVRNNVTELATFSKGAAEECGYVLKRSGKAILGPSIRLAEIVASQYGNCRVGARVIHVDRFEKYVEAEGIFHDLETNTAVTARVRRRISDRDGRLYNDDMITTTGNAACSIAKRNAIFGGVPKALWMPAYEAAMAAAKGDIKTLAEQRSSAMQAFAKHGIRDDQIFASLGIEGIDDLGLDEVLTLRTIYTAVAKGEATLEEFFPEKAAAEDAKEAAKGTAAKLGKIAAGKSASKPKSEKPKDTDKADAAAGHDEAKPEEVRKPEEDPDASSTEADDKAYQRGYRAGVQGRDRACPPDIRKDDHLVSVWERGFDQGAAEAEADAGSE